MAANRKSLRTQIDEVMAQMTDLAKEEKPSTARVSLLTCQLETLRYLHQQEIAAENEALAAEIEQLKKEIAELTAGPSATTQTTSDPLDDIVKGMLERHANQGETPVSTKTATPTPATPRTPVSDAVSDDADFLI